ncbi:putative ABC-transporter extracellular domain-containing protein [Lupinus albus]|uniref:Putative ABC-transporter extracellular domain-containing protein n=1 Tax=Lupinus albus TaxID=3870 RepID=A0A6A4PEG7_LUPAL|nr:putative ABC-transporter extracellular domain-containing protein [Lupinus albus]
MVLLEYDMASESGRDSFARASNAEWVEEDEEELQMAALLRLPTTKRANLALLRNLSSSSGNSDSKKMNNIKMEQIDVRRLNRLHRERLVKNALATNDQDNYKLLSDIKNRLKRVGLEVPNIEVRYNNLTIGADVQIGSRALPTLLNYTRDCLEGFITGLGLNRPKRHSLTILNNISGVIKPGR